MRFEAERCRPGCPTYTVYHGKGVEEAAWSIGRSLSGNSCVWWSYTEPCLATLYVGRTV